MPLLAPPKREHSISNEANMNYRKVLGCIIILTPFAIFAIIYFLLGLCPNYLFAEVDTEGVYNLERELFGVTLSNGERVIPQVFFRYNHWAIADILSGLFYLCWVPVPVIYTVVLLFQNREDLALRLSSAFLMVNIIGFIGYYIHPAAPPWYVMQHGFDVIYGTQGSAAGFLNFDNVTGGTFFHDFYTKNANVFAAIPSLHSAYNVVAFCYAMKIKGNTFWQTFIGTVMVGIWFAAVYSGHHYIIDVLLGIATAIAGTVLYEVILHRINCVKRMHEKAVNRIKL